MPFNHKNLTTWLGKCMSAHDEPPKRIDLRLIFFVADRAFARLGRTECTDLYAGIGHEFSQQRRRVTGQVRSLCTNEIVKTSGYITYTSVSNRTLVLLCGRLRRWNTLTKTFIVRSYQG
jgi:hypothetical protein